MDKIRFANNLYSSSFLLVAALLPFNQPYINYAIIFLALTFFLSLLVDRSRIKLSESLFLLPVFFYALHTIGLIYSHNLHYGLLDIQTKLSYLFFPLLFLIKPIEVKYRTGIKLLFVISSALACSYNIFYSLWQYHLNNNINTFYYIAFSRIMHVQYFSIYLNLAILFVIEMLSSKAWSKVQVALFSLLIIFFLINISLLSSRLAIVVSYVTVALLFVLKFREKPQIANYWPFAVSVVAIVVIIDFSVLGHVNRFEQVEIFFNGDNDFYKFDKKEYNSATIRIPLWINAAEVIDDNKLLGVGTGDIKEELDSVYIKNKFAFAEASHFSPHNQILHTGIILGFVGITMLLSMLLIPLYYSIRYKSYLLMCFIIIFFFNMMTESILERQAGIILFSFFYVILIAELYEDIKKAEELPA